MTRRPNNVRNAGLAATAVAVAVVLALGGRATTARADAISTGSNVATYVLTVSSDVPAADPNATAPQVIASVAPVGAVVPPTQSDGTQASPLTILPSFTDANGKMTTTNGLDQNQLIVALKDNTTDSGGGKQQLLGLSFFGQGLKSTAHGGELVFSLDVSNPSSPPALQSLTPGVTITNLPTPPPPSTTTTSSSSSSSSSPTTSTPPPPTVVEAQVPEPASLALWSALAGAGLVAARVRRSRA